MGKADKVKHTDQALTKTRKAILKIYGCILLIGLSYYLWVRSTGLGMSCFYYKTTGLLCPGCGISRMFMSMFSLDFSSAFFYNPVCFCLFFLWNFIAIMCYIGKPAVVRSKVFIYSILWASVISLILFCILRNFL